MRATASILPVLLAACGAGTPPPGPLTAPAGLVDASGPKAVSDIAWRYGTASWRTDGFGDPVIEATMDAISYRIEFYGCRDGSDCTEIRFLADRSPRKALAPKDVAGWNAAHRFGKAAIRDGRLAVEMDATLAGGVTGANLDAIFGWWRVVLVQSAVLAAG